MSESTATTSREERRERWRGLVSEQRSSGESMRGFCRGRAISYPRFLAWAKRFAANGDGARFERFGVAGGRGAGDAFCELRVGASSVFEVVVGGVVVRAPSGFDEDDLARLLRVVRDLACPFDRAALPLSEAGGAEATSEMFARPAPRPEGIRPC